jgi:hypothetical protein
MRRVLRVAFPILLVLILPSALLAQGAIKISSVYGPVEWKSASSRSFRPLTASTQMVQVGDELRTGPGGTAMLELPDGSYMVVSENSNLTIQDFWGSNLKSMVNLVLGKVRFFIQRFGGKPNPYRVTTPTALIAVRGTTFEVTIDEAQITEVRCFEGRVAVETAGLPDREVILDQGRKTLVRPGEYPLAPVANDEALLRNRVVAVVKKNTPESGNTSATVSGVDLSRDNDRRNRTVDPLNPASRTNSEVLRGKPTLKFPGSR